MKQFSLTREALYVETLRVQWVEERQKLERTVAECAAAKTTPGPNYWEAEHRAEQRFKIALRVLEVLDGSV